MIVEYDANGTEGNDLALMDVILTYDDGRVVRMPAVEYEKNPEQYVETVDPMLEKVAALEADLSQTKKKIDQLSKEVKK
jgi:hypothetical protein